MEVGWAVAWGPEVSFTDDSDEQLRPKPQPQTPPPIIIYSWGKICLYCPQIRSELPPAGPGSALGPHTPREHGYSPKLPVRETVQASP